MKSSEIDHVLGEMKIMLKDMIREERERQMNRCLDVLDEIKLMLRKMVREKQRQEGMDVTINGSEALKTTLPSQSAMEYRRSIRIYVDLHGFDGTASEDWIAQAEYFFTNRGTQDDLKFPLAFVHMVGPAYDWVRKLRRQILNLSWEQLKLEMINSFSTFHTTPVLNESYYEDVVGIEESEAKGHTIQVSIEEEKDIFPKRVNGNGNIVDSAGKSHMDISEDTIIEVEDQLVDSDMGGIDADIPAIGVIEEPRAEESNIVDIKQGVVTGGSHQMDVFCSDKIGTKLPVDKDLVEVFAKGVVQDTVILMAARASRTKNQDARDTTIVGMLSDPKEAKAGIQELIEKADDFVGVFLVHKYEIVKLEATIFGVPASTTYRAIWDLGNMLEAKMFGVPDSTTSQRFGIWAK